MLGAHLRKARSTGLNESNCQSGVLLGVSGSRGWICAASHAPAESCLDPDRTLSYCTWKLPWVNAGSESAHFWPDSWLEKRDTL